MKKIFGLFAAAALAATGLTCCGGGGGGNGSIAYKTIYFSALGGETPEGEVVPGSVGSMYIEVLGEIPEGNGNFDARVGFGHKGTAGSAVVTVTESSENSLKMTFTIDEYQGMENDRNAVAFFQIAMADVEFTDGQADGVVQFPGMLLTLDYNEGSKSAGNYTAQFAGQRVTVNDDGGEGGGEGGNGRVEVELPDKASGKFIIYG